MMHEDKKIIGQRVAICDTCGRVAHDKTTDTKDGFIIRRFKSGSLIEEKCGGTFVFCDVIPVGGRKTNELQGDS